MRIDSGVTLREANRFTFRTERGRNGVVFLSLLSLLRTLIEKLKVRRNNFTMARRAAPVGNPLKVIPQALQMALAILVVTL